MRRHTPPPFVREPFAFSRGSRGENRVERPGCGERATPWRAISNRTTLRLFVDIEFHQTVEKPTTRTKASSRVPHAGRPTREARDPVVRGVSRRPFSRQGVTHASGRNSRGSYLQSRTVVKRTRSATT